ncbi:hypothetical protein IWQ56_005395 [Coemansia nantahalensis]|nr:hypothetical protein IWQ56_005395 [Coemansia nantahalensis]
MSDGHPRSRQQMHFPSVRDHHSAAHTRRPSTHASSGFGRHSSRSGSSMASSMASGQRHVPYSFLAVTKDCIKSLEIADVVPLVTTLTGALIYHFRNRKNGRLVPFGNPDWVEYVCNGAMFYSAYSFAKSHNIIGSIKSSLKKHGKHLAVPLSGDGKRSLSNVASHSTDGTRGLSNATTRSVDGKRGLASVAPAAATAEVRRLFGSAAMDPGNAIDEYDVRAAVPREAARRHYYDVYHSGSGVREAGPQVFDSAAAVRAAGPEVLGGAAAVRALRGETAQQLLQRDQAGPADKVHNMTIMDCALAEVADLLGRKAAAGPLGPADTIENVGRIALATIINIKTERHHRRSATPMHRANGMASVAA